MHCMNGRDEGASACCSISNDGHCFDATTVAAEIRLKLMASGGGEKAPRNVEVQIGTHVCFREVWVEAKENDVWTWLAGYESFLAIRPACAAPLVVPFGSIVLNVTLAMVSVVVAVFVALAGIISLNHIR